MNPLLLAALLFLPLFLFLAAERRRRKKPISATKINLPPSPPRLPFIGNLHQLGSFPHRTLRDLSKKHGPVILLHLGRVPTLVVSSAGGAEQILKTHDVVFASRPSLKFAKVMLNGFDDVAFSPYGESWRKLRKICVSHLLSSKMVSSFSQMRREEAILLLERIAHAASRSIDGVVCLNEFLSSFAVDMVCKPLLGSSMSEERTQVVAEMVHMSSTIFSCVLVEDYFPGLRWLDLLFGSERRLRRLKKRWDDLLGEIFEDHVGRLREGESKKSADFIDTLLELQKDPSLDFELKREHTRAVLLDMFSAGIETTTATLEWAMAELLQNPEVMKTLQQEVQEIAHGEGIINEEDLSKMSYLKAVIKEVLRLHPPAPLLLPRESLEDCQIQGYDIPMQTRVFINAWAIGRNKAYWEAPEEFWPERFLDSSVDYMGKDFHFIPFGAGRRICPGLQFSIADIEIVIANLIHHFHWKLPSGFTSKDLKMDEIAGLVVQRKQKLELVPIPISH